MIPNFLFLAGFLEEFEVPSTAFDSHLTAEPATLSTLVLSESWTHIDTVRMFETIKYPAFPDAQLHLHVLHSSARPSDGGYIRPAGLSVCLSVLKARKNRTEPRLTWSDFEFGAPERKGTEQTAPEVD